MKDIDISFSYDDLAPAMGTVPDDVTHVEGYFQSSDKLDLFYQSWSQPDPQKTVVIMHGYGEHSARYHHVASAMARTGCRVVAMDARGHGRSAGERGYVRTFDQYVDDLQILIDREQAQTPDLSIYILGHSNGGLIALRHALRKSVVKSYVVTSPYLGLAAKVPAAKLMAGKLLGKVYGKFSLPGEIASSDLSHDPKIVETYPTDPLNLNIVNSRWFNESADASDRLSERAGSIKKPVLWLVAGSDRIADANVAEKIFHKLGSASREFELFPDLYHEILNEEPWPDLTEMVLNWFDSNV